MKVGKPTSKRTPVRLRHKIHKASLAKQKKGRKEAKKNPQWQSRLKKDPGIPNLFPYKAKVLAEIEESRRRKEEEAQQRRDVAKAQRQGKAVTATTTGGVAVVEAEEDEDVLLDEVDAEDDDEMEVQDESNPMAALLASAQARAQAYSKDDENDLDDDEEDDEEAEDDEWAGIDDAGTSAPGQATRKALPKQALADPIKAVTTLITRLQDTQEGIQRLIDHYQLPPIVTGGSDTTTRFLVDVARKRGRLGRGGVPNLHAAALIVLTDLNEEKISLPAAAEVKKGVATGAVAANKGEVQIVTQMAEPFRIEGLFEDVKKGKGQAEDGGMVVET